MITKVIDTASTNFLKLTIVHSGSRVEVFTKEEVKPKRVLKALINSKK